MPARRSAIILLALVLVLISGQPSRGSRSAFTPRGFFDHTSLVCEARLVSRGALTGEARLEGRPGWYYPTDRVCLVIEKVIRQFSQPAVGAGDTIFVRIPTSGVSTSLDQPHLITSGGESRDFTLQVGKTGFFGLNRGENGEFLPGPWFVLKPDQVEDFLEYISQWEADSTRVFQGEKRY